MAIQFCRGQSNPEYVCNNRCQWLRHIFRLWVVLRNKFVPSRLVGVETNRDLKGEDDTDVQHVDDVSRV